jgi:hypothetical protein
LLFSTLQTANLQVTGIMSSGPSDVIVRGGVRLPRSSPRNCRTFLKLLSNVDPEASTGFGFEGILLHPGSTVSEAELRPSDDYPVNAVVLEYAEIPSTGHRGHNRKDQLYILWRFDRDRNLWIELGRSRSVSWEWALDLRPLAIRALREARILVPEIMPNVYEIALRISGVLDLELKRLEPSDQRKVLGVLHDQFACRRCA